MSQMITATMATTADQLLIMHLSAYTCYAHASCICSACLKQTIVVATVKSTFPGLRG